jgi:hypothetical protein
MLNCKVVMGRCCDQILSKISTFSGVTEESYYKPLLGQKAFEINLSRTY